MKLAICAFALALVPVSAAAQKRPKPKPIAAQFLCGTLVGGKIGKPISGGATGKLTDPLACAIHMDDPKESSHMGNVHTVRYADPKKPTTTSGSTDDFGANSTNKDFEVVLKPNVADANGEVPWKTCEDFDIVATISDDLGVYYTKTIKVQQGCPAAAPPKPIAAELTCTYEASDGTLYRWPGNGAKVKPRLSTSSHELSCQISGKGDLPRGETFTGSIAAKGLKTRKSATRAVPGGGWTAELAFDDIDDCADTTLEGTLVDGTGAKRWSGNLRITQFCPD